MPLQMKAIFFCDFCMSESGREKKHVCNITFAIDNLVNITKPHGSKTAQRVTLDLLKFIEQEENVKEGKL